MPVRGSYDTLSVEPCYVKNGFASVRSTEHKPWIVFIRMTTARFNGDARTN
jgi:hypothetical protein